MSFDEWEMDGLSNVEEIDYMNEDELEQKAGARRAQIFSLKDLFFVILLIALLAGMVVVAKIIYTYEMPVFDPIADLKDAVMNIETFYLAFSTGFLIFAFIFFFLYEVRKLYMVIVMAMIFSVLMICSLFGAKFYLDSTYTEEKFVEMYYQSEYRQEIGRTPIKEFVEGNVVGYKNFTLKNTINMVLNFFVAIIEVYFFVHVKEVIHRQDTLREMDAALFDDEINVKI